MSDFISGILIVGLVILGILLVYRIINSVCHDFFITEAPKDLNMPRKKTPFDVYEEETLERLKQERKAFDVWQQERDWKEDKELFDEWMSDYALKAFKVKS